ncbi:hypothetical protein [Flavobacterium ajazii]|nr:hypothetical protein [Flavobacterium ajazii]
MYSSVDEKQLNLIGRFGSQKQNETETEPTENGIEIQHLIVAEYKT